MSIVKTSPQDTMRPFGPEDKNERIMGRRSSFFKSFCCRATDAIPEDPPLALHDELEHYSMVSVDASTIAPDEFEVLLTSHRHVFPTKELEHEDDDDDHHTSLATLFPQTPPRHQKNTGGVPTHDYWNALMTRTFTATDSTEVTAATLFSDSDATPPQATATEAATRTTDKNSKSSPPRKSTRDRTPSPSPTRRRRDPPASLTPSRLDYGRDDDGQDKSTTTPDRHRGLVMCQPYDTFSTSSSKAETLLNTSHASSEGDESLDGSEQKNPRSWSESVGGFPSAALIFRDDHDHDQPHHNTSSSAAATVVTTGTAGTAGNSNGSITSNFWYAMAQTTTRSLPDGKKKSRRSMVAHRLRPRRGGGGGGQQDIRRLTQQLEQRLHAMS